MSNPLIIVESPTKARIITKFLDNKYSVVSSMGHVRDLPEYRFGVDLENGFKPEYEIIKGKKKVLSQISKLLKGSEQIYLAMDEDREGEAIGWHLVESLDLDEKKYQISRIAFHEITEEAVRAAIGRPRSINMDLVDAQQARRILDRIVGYKISPLLSKKIRRGLSAGRVQSVGLKMIVLREKEREKFVPQKYFSIEGEGRLDGRKFPLKLWGKDGKKYKKLQIGTTEEADRIIEECRSHGLEVKAIQEKEKRNNPFPPFITSSLQQEAYKKFGYNPDRTMLIAQQLYEGVELPDGSSSGLITYMRTDSVQIAKTAQENARKYIKDKIGEEYLPSKPKIYRSKKSAQEAHECIRPTVVDRTPDSMEAVLDKNQLKLYRMIWERFVSSQMKPALIKSVQFDLDCAGYTFRASGQRLIFDGYTRIWKSKIEEAEIPELEKGDKAEWEKIEKIEHETKPPARYTPATLVNELEKNGIGRPSTYATILKTLFKRKYIVSSSGSLVPEEIGVIVIEKLVRFFPKLIDIKFTARMEDNLDEVAEGKQKWNSMIEEFFGSFSRQYQSALTNMEKVKDEETDKKCPECGAKMVIRWGRNGKFMGCSAYPECRKTFNLDGNGDIIKEETEYKCPKCGEPLLRKRGRYGYFLACSAYPECKTTLAIDKDGEIIQIPLGYEKCPQCGMDTVIRKGRKGFFLACTGYPKCKFSKELDSKKDS